MRCETLNHKTEYKTHVFKKTNNVLSGLELQRTSIPDKYFMTVLDKGLYPLTYPTSPPVVLHQEWAAQV